MSKKNQKRKKAMKEQQGGPRPWRQIDDVVVDAHGRIVKAPHGCSWEGDNYNDGAAAARAIVEAINNSRHPQSEPDKIYEAIVWTHAECCAALGRGEDPRQMDIAKMLERGIRDLTRD